MYVFFTVKRVNTMSEQNAKFLNEKSVRVVIFFVALRPNADHGLLILEVSRSHITTHHSR